MIQPGLVGGFLLLISILSPIEGKDGDPGEPLLLTPLIKQGLHAQAREAALVPSEHSIVSYSGFITVDEAHNSNLFFWYFPAEPSYDQAEDSQDEEIPVLLWSEGGPGCSLMFSIFNYNGPFKGEKNGVNFTLNPYSWHKRYHMIYMDNPVDVGFSHTGSDLGHVDTDEGAAVGIYEFLQQFFRMFPHLQKNPFYNAGGSYGATYALHTAQLIQLIHQRNLEGKSDARINLSGIVVDGPWIDPPNQLYYSDYLWTLGLINGRTREELAGKEEEARRLMDQEKFAEAHGILMGLIGSAVNITGYSALHHALDDQWGWSDMTPWATSPQTRRSLHVGNLPFHFISYEKLNSMGATMMRSCKDKLDQLLQAGYPFLLTVGNMDVLTGLQGVQRMLSSLEWEGKEELVEGDRETLRLEGKKGIAGYLTHSGKATLAIVRNTGHGCFYDKQEEVLDIMATFFKDNRVAKKGVHDEF